MKKLFPDDEKGSRKGFREFLDKKGFYVVLLLCIAVVAGTALFVTTRNATSSPPDYQARNLTSQDAGKAAVGGADKDSQLNAQQQPEDTQASALPQKQSDIGKPAAVTGSEKNSAVQPKENAAKTDKPDATPAQDKKSTPKSSTPKKAASAKLQDFIMPVAGDISVAFTKDKLVYSNTLETWQAHKGIDIASDRGTPVKAVAEGVISDIRNDAYYGITVVIDHGKGLQTLYRNLAADDVVSVNQKIKQGEVIGSIGNTAADESIDQPHLHFEVLKNNVKVDPLTYLPKSSSAQID